MIGNKQDDTHTHKRQDDTHTRLHTHTRDKMTHYMSNIERRVRILTIGKVLEVLLQVGAG